MTQRVEVVVGVVGRANGTRGAVAVELRTDEPETRFADGTRLRVEDSRSTRTVRSTRWQSGRLIASFTELTDRTAAERARGEVLVIDVDPDQPPADEDEFYDRQLVGLKVTSADGSDVGVVRQVLHLPRQDVLAIDTPAGAERLVPFVSELVPSVDLGAGEIRLAEVPGLIDDDAVSDREPEGESE